MLTLPPLSLYVHIPWCVRKCPYCDFNSHKADTTLPEAEYLQRLEQDLQEELPYVQGRRLHSIFFGGGTPSLFSANSIGTILAMADTYIGIDTTTEITLEANPGTFEQAKFAGYRQAGVNRLSIGVQSFNQQHLSRLGRIHDSGEAIRAITLAQAAGFDNINLDLMHGLPEQTAAQATQDLQQAIDLGPNHISWYQLTIEPNTEFYRRPPTLPIDDLLADIQDHGHQLLHQNGYNQYEISAYCQPQQAAKHNLNYWQFGDYIGIGAGAHGKLTALNNNKLITPHSDSIIRRRKTRLPQHYLDISRQSCSASEAIKTDELPLEFLMNALRLTDGVDASLFTQRTGLPLSLIESPLQNLRNQELLHINPERIATTPLGNRYLNSLLQQFL